MPVTTVTGIFVYGPTFPAAAEEVIAIASSTVAFARLLGARRTDRGPDVLALLRRRQHRLHSQRLDPQLTAPSLGVVEVLILLRLDLAVG
jgi:hypothetical protein